MNCFAVVWMIVLIARVFNWSFVFWFNIEKKLKKITMLYKSIDSILIDAIEKLAIDYLLIYMNW